MKIRPYERSHLWRNAFSKKRGDPDERDRQALADAFRQLRDRAGDLVNEIHAVLPSLTVHDLTHADTLWDVASEICGAKFELNPLEAFVLGASFLLHDAGMALAAYPGGLDELQKSVQWRDGIASAWKKRGVDFPSTEQLSDPGVEITNEVTFQILRSQHASQAKKLVSTLWRQPSSGQPMALIQNDDLLESYGLLIGNVAASHHWPLPEVGRFFGDPKPASAAWPREWDVDGLLLACILRCADACAIDETRAPSFLYALRNPQGASKRHWAFQNKIYPAKRRADALLFESKSAFSPDETDDWWLCFDAIEIADRELRGCDGLLADRGRRAFVVRRAVGAGDPDVLAQTVQVEGWKPVNTLPRISNPTSIIERLGGKQLYGNDAVVPIRELIQNSVDAIRARRFVDPHFSRDDSEKYPGSIRLRFERIIDSDDTWIIVEDDGVGMSYQTVTRSLLDFGASFWSSDSAARLYPGLPSETKFKPIGRFGIGFFSVFMYASIVVVSSREFHGSRKAWNVLSFSHGVHGRGNFHVADAPPRDVSSETNTVVMMRVESAFLESIPDRRTWDRDVESLFEAIVRRLRIITAALDVKVEIASAEYDLVELNHPLIYERSADDVAELLKLCGDDWESFNDVEAQIGLLAPMGDEERGWYGYCAASLRAFPSTLIKSTGGIGSFERWGADEQLFGIAEFTVKAANREPNELAAPRPVVEEWARNQISRLTCAKISDESREQAAYNLGELIEDIGVVFRVRSNLGWLDLDEFISRLKRFGSVYIPVRPIGKGVFYAGFVYKYYEGEVTIRWEEMEFASFLICPNLQGREGAWVDSGRILSHTRGRVGFWNTIQTALARMKINFEACLLDECKIAKYVGLDSERHNLHKGADIMQSAVLLKVVN